MLNSVEQFNWIKFDTFFHTLMLRKRIDLYIILVQNTALLPIAFFFFAANVDLREESSFRRLKLTRNDPLRLVQL